MSLCHFLSLDSFLTCVLCCVLICLMLSLLLSLFESLSFSIFKIFVFCSYFWIRLVLPNTPLSVLDVWPCLCFIVKIHARTSSCDSLQKGSHLGSGHACWSQSVRLLVFQVEFIFAILKTNVVFLKHILKISIIGMHDHCVVKNLAHT